MQPNQPPDENEHYDGPLITSHIPTRPRHKAGTSTGTGCGIAIVAGASLGVLILVTLLAFGAGQARGLRPVISVTHGLVTATQPAPTPCGASVRPSTHHASHAPRKKP